MAKAKKITSVTYIVVEKLGVVREMARYEGGSVEILEVIKDDTELNFGFDDFNIVRAKITSPYRNDARWASFGVRWSGESQLHRKGLVV